MNSIFKFCHLFAAALCKQCHPERSEGRWTIGLIDEVAFFNVALTEDDINEIMDKGLAKTVVQDVDVRGKLTTTWGGIKSAE